MTPLPHAGLDARGPALSLPTGRLLATLLGACVLVGGGWAAVVAATGGEPGLARSGLLGGGIVAVCSTAGLLAIGPWKQRPVPLWISLWLGQTVVRLLLTPLVAWLLYSAAPATAPMPLAVAVGLTYLVAVVSEATVLAGYLKRSGSP
jgi:hypothetical protein